MKTLTTSITIFNCACFYILGVSSQDVNIKLGNSFNLESAADKYEIVYVQPETGTFTLKHPPSVSDPVMWFEEMNFDNGLVKTTSIKRSEGTFSENKLYEKYLITNEGLLLFYRGWSKSNKKASYEIGFCSFNGELKENKKELDAHEAKNKLKAGDFDVAISPDKSTFVLATTYPYVKGENEKIGIKVFDSKTFSEKWSKQIVLDIPDEKGKNNQVLIDNSGTIFLLKRLVINKEYVYKLMCLSQNDDKWNEIPISLEGNQVAEGQFLMHNNTIYFTGFFFSKTQLIWDGTFCIKVNPETKSVDHQSFTKFGERISSGKGITDFKFKDVLFMSDNRFQLIAEYQKEKLSTKTNSQGQAVYDNKYETNNVIVICYKEDGSIDWEVTVTKDQTQQSNEKTPLIKWNSFAYALVNDNLYILYNNLNLLSKWVDLDNVEYKSDKFIRCSRKPFLYVVQSNGGVTYGDKKYGLPLFSLFANSTGGLRDVLPYLAVPQDDGMIFFGATQDGKDIQMGKIKLN